MKSIILLEIVSIVSFIYSILLILFPFAPINEVIIVFIWTIIVSSILASNQNKLKKHQAVTLLLLLPLIFYHSMKAINFIIMMTIIISLYINKSIMKGSYGEYIGKLKQTYGAYTVVAALALINKKFYGLITYGIPFIIIYLLTTIILVRLVRHLDSGIDMDKMRKVNTRYLSIVSLISLIVTIDGLRLFIFSTIKNTYFFIIDIILKIFYYPLEIILNLINKLVVFLRIKIMENSTLDFMFGELGFNQFAYVDEEFIYTDSPIVSKIIGFLLILIVIYIIYRLIAKAGERNHKGLEYTEEREYIRNPREKKKRFSREKYPRELKEQIRYYYRRYLEKLDKKKVKVLKSDTSLDVNEKAEKAFEEEIDKIRDIYIHSRYGNKEVNKAMVEEIETIYKKL